MWSLSILPSGRGSAIVDHLSPDGSVSGDYEIDTTDGGRTWTYAARPTNAGGSPAPVWLSEEVGFRSGAAPTITLDAGHHWSAQRGPADMDNVSRLAMDGSQLWATGDRCTAVDCHTALLSGRIGGRLTWLQIPGVSWAFDITATDGVAYALGADAIDGHGPGVLAVTHNGGRTWQRLRGPCGDGDLVGPARVTAISEVEVQVQCAMYSAATPFRTTNLTLHVSRDGGHTWINATRTLPARLSDAVLVGGRVWATFVPDDVVGSALLRSDDLGRTWVGSPPRVIGLYDAPALSVIDANRVVWAHTRRHGQYVQLVIASTTDGGHSWHDYVVPLPA
jgi:photosystem II stability/assembly factor-like uncharacterized protein